MNVQNNNSVYLNMGHLFRGVYHREVYRSLAKVNE